MDQNVQTWRYVDLGRELDLALFMAPILASKDGSFYLRDKKWPNILLTDFWSLFPSFLV